MIRIIFALLLFTLSGQLVTAQVTLKIVIDKLENNTGHLLLDFRDANDEPLKEFTEKIKDKQCVITINNLEPGKYSFKYFHDENNNKKLDTYWIGAPKEGMGFSNNAKGKFGPPDFEDTIFEVNEDTTVACSAYYIEL